MVKIVNRFGDVKIGKQGEVVYQRKYGEQIRRGLSPKRAIASEAQIAHRQLYRTALDWRKQLSLPNRRYLDGYCWTNGVIDSYGIPLPWSRFALKLYLEKVKFVVITKPTAAVAGEETKQESYEEGDTYDAPVRVDWNWAQTFTPLASHNISRVEVLIFVKGNPSGTGKVSLRLTDGSGHPTGADLVYTEFAIPGDLPTSKDWYSFDLPSYSLSQGVKYALVLAGVGQDPNNSLIWRLNTTTASYPRGNCEISTNWGVDWSAYLTYDFLFKEFGSTIGQEAVKGLLHVRHPALLAVVHKRGEQTIYAYDTLSSLDEEYLTGQVGLDVEAEDYIEATTLPGIKYAHLVR